MLTCVKFLRNININKYILFPLILSPYTLIYTENGFYFLWIQFEFMFYSIFQGIQVRLNARLKIGAVQHALHVRWLLCSLCCWLLTKKLVKKYFSHQKLDITQFRSILFYNTSARHERHKCVTNDTSVTRVRHQQHERNTGTTRVLHNRHDCDTSDKFCF